MSWVIWDILVPLLITFCLGLGLGWMLWRWRRQSASADIHVANTETRGLPSSADLSLAADNESMNIALIEERDHALRIASEANASVDALQDRILELENAPQIETATVVSPSIDFEADSSSEAEMSAVLEKEQADKGRLERALLDANSRYKTLALELESVVNGADAASMKDSAALKSKYERSIEKIDELEQALQLAGAGESENKPDDAATQLEALKAELNTRDQTIDQLRNKLAQSANDAGVADTDDGKITDIRGRKTTEPLVCESSVSDAGLSPEQAEQTDAGGDQKNSVKAAAPVEKEIASDSPTDSNHATEDKSVVLAAMKETSKTNVHDKVGSEKDDGIADLQKVGTSEAKPSIGSATAKVSKKTKSTAEKPPSEVEVQSATDQTLAAGGSAANKQTSAASGRNLTLVPDKNPATATGYVPNGWEVPGTEPEKDQRDKLTDIKGVGPVLEKALHATGIYYFQQMAMLDDKGIDELQQQIPQFPGRIQRDQWVDQARELYEKKYGEAVVG